VHRIIPKRMARGTQGPGLAMLLLCVAEGASKQPCCCLQAALGSPSHPTSLPGRSPGCEGSAGSGSAGDTPSGRGVGREKGGKARDRERGTASRQSTAAAALGLAPFSSAQVAAEEASPKVPPPCRAGTRCRSSPFCCRASWRLVSMSWSVAARLRGRLPAGLGGPWAGRQAVSCGDRDGGWHQARRSHGRAARGRAMPRSPQQPYLGRGAAPQQGEVELRGRGGPTLHPRGEGTSVALSFGTVDLGTETWR